MQADLWLFPCADVDCLLCVHYVESIDWLIDVCWRIDFVCGRQTCLEGFYVAEFSHSCKELTSRNGNKNSACRKWKERVIFKHSGLCESSFDWLMDWLRKTFPWKQSNVENQSPQDCIITKGQIKQSIEVKQLVSSKAKFSLTFFIPSFLFEFLLGLDNTYFTSLLDYQFPFTRRLLFWDFDTLPTAIMSYHPDEEAFRDLKKLELRTHFPEPQRFPWAWSKWNRTPDCHPVCWPSRPAVFSCLTWRCCCGSNMQWPNPWAPERIPRISWPRLTTPRSFVWTAMSPCVWPPREVMIHTPKTIIIPIVSYTVLNSEAGWSFA